MKLIAGLGNIGKKYEGTRHNVGFVVAHQVSGGVGWRESKKFLGKVCEMGEVILLMPTTFMNESGRAVRATMDFYKISPDDLYVIHDDLDIKLGEYKIQLGKGPKVHYGVESVEKYLKTDQFWRVRIGVENRRLAGNKGIPGMRYVLQQFTVPEQKQLDEVVGRVVAELSSVLS